jgi:hypothetical protein
MFVGANHNLPLHGLIMIGQTISHHRILEKLGEGGIGVGHEAEGTDFRLTRSCEELEQFVPVKARGLTRD